MCTSIILESLVPPGSIPETFLHLHEFLPDLRLIVIPTGVLDHLRLSTHQRQKDTRNNDCWLLQYWYDLYVLLSTPAQLPKLRGNEDNGTHQVDSLLVGHREIENLQRWEEQVTYIPYIITRFRYLYIPQKTIINTIYIYIVNTTMKMKTHSLSCQCIEGLLVSWFGLLLTS